MRRTAIRIATGALFVLCCFFAASIITDISASMLVQTPTLSARPADATATHVRSHTDRQRILERNLFGSREEAEPVVVAEVEFEENLEETRLPVKLLGTVASKNPRIARAAIANRSGSEHQIVQIGDHLEKHPQAEVVAIEPRRVVLQNGSRREELALEDEETTLAALNLDAKMKRDTRGARSSRKRSKPRARSTVTTSNRGKVNQLQKLAELASRGKTGGGLLSDAKVMPKFDNKEMVGVEVSSIEAGSFLEKLGLKDGDLISEVNGIVIDSPEAGQQVLDALARNQELSAIVNGEPITVNQEQLTELRSNSPEPPDARR
ncbi:MAG: type II secretion system protein N [Myxococcota bacterium]